MSYSNNLKLASVDRRHSASLFFRHRESAPIWGLSFAIGWLLMVCAGCSNQSVATSPKKSPRAVTAIELTETTPSKMMELTGSVASWKTEDIGFQVAGRVKSVVEPGIDISGQTVDENDKVISDGDMLAALDTDRYVLAVSSSKAQLDTARAEAKAKESELKTVIPQNVKAAQAAVTLARQEFERVSSLLKEAAVSEAQFDKAQANLDSTQAELEQVQATEAVAKAELDSLNARAKEAEEAVRQAEKDLADTTLLSAFNGQVARVHKIPGSVVQAGGTGGTGQMMDPIKIDISVSAETDARLNYNDVVNITLPQSEETLQAMVYEKATLADAATRTFNVTLLVRNQKIEVGLPEDESLLNSYRVRAMWNLFTEKANQSPPYFVSAEAIYQDAEGHYVWLVTNRSAKLAYQQGDPQLTLKKVRVTLGERRIPFLQVATMRELKDHGELKPNESLIAGQFFDPQGQAVDQSKVSELIQEGDTVLYVRSRWKIRPGDIVRVQLPGDVPKPGLYVAADLILSQAGQESVFAIVEKDGKTTASRIAVKVFDQVGTKRRIEPATEGALTAGMKIVAGGALLLSDGEEVMVEEIAEGAQQ